MFENIIEQGAVLQLRGDILSKRSAPSMLFFGPSGTGKGSAALELARSLSCEGDASWKCACSACERHRYLQHDDLLALGKRAFSAEIAASSAAFLRNPQALSAKMLFIRSLRKLQLRFSPVLTEDDSKFSKISKVLQSFDEKLNDFWNISEKNDLEKLSSSIVEDALILENDGISAKIPIGQIRNASYWCRLAPNGKHKTLIIENAENMREEARNSLLKLLEEPPSNVSIVLTSGSREAIMPTILSRLRPYRFLRRSAESEKEVIRRVFQDTVNEKIEKQQSSLINAYLESFSPQNNEKLIPLAAWFVVSLARIASVSIKRKTGKIPEFFNTLGERYAPIAEKSGFERSLRGAGVVKKIIFWSGNFEDVSFSRFLESCLDLVGGVTRTSEDPRFIEYQNIFGKNIAKAASAVDMLNINAAMALESLFYKIKTDMIRGSYG